VLRGQKAVSERLVSIRFFTSDRRESFLRVYTGIDETVSRRASSAEQ
jgi:hypothetical protein